MSLLKYHTPGRREAGCDEAGRGALAGPVYAAAVILPDNFHNSLLNDSKKMSKKNRNLLRMEIEQRAIAWCVASVSAGEIDKINILNASIAAMHKALEGLKIQPEHIIVDGNRFKDFSDIPHSCIVGGDSKYLSIAAASVLAKTHRDEFMEKIAKEYPEFGWDKNMAYPTTAHREAIRIHGATPHHRMSFSLYGKLSNGK